MKHLAATVCVLLSSLALVAFARDQLYSLQFPKGIGAFDVIDGVPYLLRPGEKPSPGNAIDIVDGKKLVHVHSSKALSYSLEGDDPTVALGKDGDEWQVGPLGERKKFFVRAAQGRFKDRYLDWSDDEVEIKVKDKTLHGRRLVLVKELKKEREFSSYPVAP
jgi:hypothetical protein